MITRIEPFFIAAHREEMIAVFTGIDILKYIE